MERTNHIELKHFSYEHMDTLKTFELPEEQVQFTSLPTYYKEVAEGQYRIVILYRTEPVGFFLMHSTDRVKEYSDNPQAMLLTALSINQAKH